MPDLRQRHRQANGMQPFSQALALSQALSHAQAQAPPPIKSPHRRRFKGDGSADITPVRPYTGKRNNHKQDRQVTSLARLRSMPGTSSVLRKESLLLHFDEYKGWMSPWAWLWGTIFLSIPAAYVYILLVLLRELCRNVRPVALFVHDYFPPLHAVVAFMQLQSSVWVEAWCILEAIFYIGLKIHIRWLNTRDTLEASLSAAPLLDLTSRRVLWQRMMETEANDTVGWIRGWLLDGDSLSLDDFRQQVSLSNIRAFIAWSLFEGRRIEHLTPAEAQQLESFLQELQIRISLQIYGVAEDDDDDDDDDNNHDDDNDDDNNNNNNSSSDVKDKDDDFSTHGEDFWGVSHDSGYDPWKVPRFVDLPQPKRVFSFRVDEPHEEDSSFFGDLYESLLQRYERMRRADFSPVQDLANRLAAPVSHLVHEAENTAGHVYESLVPAQMEQRLNAVREATWAQMTEAWNSVKDMRERLETARFLSNRRAALQQQLRGYRVMLHRMLEHTHASDMPRQQMVILMRRITECIEGLEGLERRAQSAFVQATGFARKNLAQLLPVSETTARRFATYSADPLLGIATYPLGFHLLILALTEIPLRVLLLLRKGFVKKRIGPVSYYFHPGKVTFQISTRSEGLRESSLDDMSDSSSMEDDAIPIVFVHGIGIGLVAYIPLIDALLETGRPLFLPEIPYVSGFRPWQSPNAVLSPQVVTSTLSAMLASHGFLRATFAGHSYGTSWLSYMCKYAEHAVAALLFLDPICFCLHAPRLTKSFVYMRPDPGTISYIVRTDVIVNWTIQRSFPWAWIILFTEQIKVPTTIFLSEKDLLVPANKVEAYLLDRSVPFCDFDKASAAHFESDAVVNGCVFRGHGHGAWTESAGFMPMIATAAEILCQRAKRRWGDEDFELQ